MRLSLGDVAARAAFGLAGSALGGFVAFDVAAGTSGRPGGRGLALLDPGHPAFQCLSVGFVAAAMLALVRAGRPSACGPVAVAWSALALGQAIGAGGGARLVARPLWVLSIAGGLFLAALVFDALAQAGYRVGKFLVTAPLVAGSFVAAAPSALVGASAGSGLGRELLMFALVGLVIGNGSGFGVETAELLFRPREPEDPLAPPPGA